MLISDKAHVVFSAMLMSVLCNFVIVHYAFSWLPQNLVKSDEFHGCMYAGLINMFLLKYDDKAPCAVHTFYPGQVMSTLLLTVNTC